MTVRRGSHVSHPAIAVIWPFKTVSKLLFWSFLRFWGVVQRKRPLDSCLLQLAISSTRPPTGWSRKEEGGVARLAVETYSSTERGSGVRTRTTWRREAHGYRHVSSSSRSCRASLVRAPARVLVTASRAPSRPPAPTRARCSYGLEQHRRSPSRCRARRRSAAQRGAKPGGDRRIAAARQDQSKQAGICERHFFR